tara:strand:- start:1378 stop:2202 length:825 start_codon:yes stop_codon:yes gene_type:complete
VAYLAELDDHRWMVRQGYASNTVTFWPKAHGAGNVQVTDTPTYEIFSPGGTSIGSGNTTVTTDASGDQLDVTVDASATATYVLDENYRIDVTWVYSGTTYVTAVYFDCVRSVVNDALGVSLNDLVEEVSDAAERLTRQGAAIVTGRTAEQHASTLAYKAWEDVRTMLRAQAGVQGTTYPRLIIDRAALRRVVIAQALHRMYRAEGGGVDSESRALAEDWREEATSRLRGLGRLAYDSSDDGVPDSVRGSFSVRRARRRWRARIYGDSGSSGRRT